jgi:hypothetical protein
MGAALEISTLDVRQPLIPLEEFYNEPLNETVGMLLYCNNTFLLHINTVPFLALLVYNPVLFLLQSFLCMVFLYYFSTHYK